MNLDNSKFDFLVDSHCHLNTIQKFGLDLECVIKEANNTNVRVINNVCSKLSEFNDILEISNKYKNVYCSVGLHPLELKEEKLPTVEEIIKFTKYKKVVGIGETGLDYHYASETRKQQIQNFETHIEAARKTNLPLIIHSRNADNDMIDILKSEMKNKEFSFVLHCFCSGEELAKTGLDLGGYISLSGIVTFGKSVELRKIIKQVSLDRILLETDSPYLAPEPKRGKTNQPVYVEYIAKYLGDFLNIPFKVVQQQTTKNVFTLFNKMGKNYEN